MKTFDKEINMLSRRRRFLLLSLAIFAVAAAACSGCSTLQLNSPGTKAKQSGPTYAVETHPAWGRPSRRSLPFDKPITVAEAVDRANAFGPFASYEVYVERPVPQSGQAHRMNVQVESGKVAASTNYAVFPGDRIVVKEQVGMIDTMIRSVTGR